LITIGMPPALRALWVAAAIVAMMLTSAQAQESEEPNRRLITIDSSGGTQSGNLRFGPINYEHPEPFGIVATVSNLTIRSPRATLSAPEGVLIAQAQGSREARFEGELEVSRGRLSASGGALRYSEATGLGVLTGIAGRAVVVRIAPAAEGDAEVVIRALQVTFDVDTDTSISDGNVELSNGNQAAFADRIEYEEIVGLGVLSGVRRPQVIRTADDGGELRIVANQIRVLTDVQAMYAVGNVIVQDGDIESRGDEVFYDDEEEVAEVIGNPAIAVDAAAGVRLETARVRQDVRFRFIEAMDASLPTPYTAEQFRLAREAVGR
jgi:lipopolysaccharide assembly outer membrane protein LptD (OstA)